MARWLVMVVVVLGGAFLLSQWFGGDGSEAAGGTPALAASRPAEPAPRPADAAEARPRQAPRPAAAEGVAGGEQAAAPEGPDPQVAQLVERAAGLERQGRRADAVALLREARQRAAGPRQRARVGLELALLGGPPLERRQLLAEAFAAGQVYGAEYDAVGAVLAELNADPAASLLPLVETATYRVRPNDSLWKLCHRVIPEEHGVQLEVGLLRLVNGLASDGLQVGQELVVPLRGVRLVVDRDQRGIVALLGVVPVVAYRVGLGKDGRTPSGEFVVQVKQEQPAWTYKNETIPYGDPRNILGTRWLGFEDHPGVTGYGIHGTTRPETIGKDESMGCVRMRNEEVEQLFELVPRGTPVTIP